MTQRKLARKVFIDDVRQIADADNLELASVGGWNVIVKKGDFKKGDIAVFFEIDSALPANDSRFDFLKERCLKVFRNKWNTTEISFIKISTMKLRGEYSQGLLMKTDDFPEVEQFNIGDDLKEVLNVQHYDEIREAFESSVSAGLQAKKSKVANTNTKGNFPFFVPKTDEERIQNLPEYFQKYKNARFEVTEKYDGSSMTAYYAPDTSKDEPYGICSRNLDLKLDADNKFINVANSIDLERKIKEAYALTGCELAIQGEMVGPGVNNNRDAYTTLDFFVFRIWNITKRKFMEATERVRLCKQIGLKHVKVMHPNLDVFHKYPTMQELIQAAQGKTDRGNEREGLVMKSIDTKTQVSFKVINNEYLLKNEKAESNKNKQEKLKESKKRVEKMEIKEENK